MSKNIFGLVKSNFLRVRYAAFAVPVLCLFLIAVFSGPNLAKHKHNKVPVCYVNKKHPEKSKTKMIAENKVDRHLEQHPWHLLGECDPVFACDDEDVAILENPDFVQEGGALEMCGEEADNVKGRWGAKEFGKCLQKETGISKSCSKCYEKIMKCSEKEDMQEICEDVCTSDDPDACLECKRSSECQIKFTECAGFEYPAPKLFQGTYKDCNCHPEDEYWVGIEKAKCTFSHSLSPMGTKEFRFRCKPHEVYAPWSVGVSGRKSNTTCTVDVDIFGEYTSKSCTNWSWTQSDGVSPWVECWMYP